ncbi:MAG: hypothetical protein R2724_26745 [Bryobacterales bacterium]
MKFLLRLLPLALIAFSAQAGVVFNVLGTKCSGTTDTLVAGPLPAVGGVQGAVMNGQCGDVFPENLTGSVYASMFGDFTGTNMPLPPQIPISFDFDIINDAEIVSWFVEISIDKHVIFSQSGGPTSGTPVSVMGGGFGNTSAFGNSSIGWRGLVSVTCDYCFGDLVIDLGNSSLRINPVAAAVPEPSTVTLFATGRAAVVPAPAASIAAFPVFEFGKGSLRGAFFALVRERLLAN